MKLHAQPRPLTAPLPGSSAGATVAVEPILTGEAEFPRAALERPGGRFEAIRITGLTSPRSSGWSWVPCPAFLITHPGVGPVLVDTGLHPSVASKPAENFGRIGAWYAKPRIEPGRDLPAQLRARGLDPKAIRYVVLTHLHYDHASGISEFPNSTFILSAAEWEAATTGGRPGLRGYRPAHYDFVFDYRTIDYSGPHIESYSTFGRTFDLFGDGSVRLAFTPGHTLGHQAVICHLRDRDFVIAGDAVYTMRQLEGGPGQPRPHDAHLWRRSLQELQLFHRQFPQAVIVPGHDAEHWTTLEARYE